MGARLERLERLAQMEKDQNQCAESDLQVKFHNMLDEMRNQTKYLESVERELVESKEERDRLTNKLSKMGEKLSETTDDKHRVEITLEDMRHHLTETREQRDCLNKNVADLQGQIEDLRMQVQLNSTYGSGLER